MNNVATKANPFADLDEDLSLPGAGQGQQPQGLGVYADKMAKTGAVVAGHVPGKQAKPHEEKCPSCRGRGRFISYTGRDCGPCFKCKGHGRLYFAQPAEVRAKQRESAAASKAKREQSLVDKFAASHRSEYEWLKAAAARGFNIAADLLAKLPKYGLSEKQVEMIRKFVWQDAERANAKLKREQTAPTVDCSGVLKALNTAKGNGLKNPKLRLDGFTFSLAKATSVNAGAVYVVHKETDTYYGKIINGKLHTSRDGAQHEASIIAVATQPASAAVAYGKKTGECACCGRELTDPVSVERGIGPICADKFGF